MQNRLSGGADLTVSKEEARLYAARIWAELSDVRRRILSELAGNYARRFLLAKGASSRIFLTAPVGYELDLLSVMSALACDLFLPVIHENSMDFVACRKDRVMVPLRAGRFQIPEPQGSEIAVPDAGDLMFVPSLACNPHRYRLGRGGGFYDRYFALHRQAKWCRKVSVLPVELTEIHFPEQSHDIKLDELVTDTGTLE
jgi:5,10-methenyltetrahydrofolate synthetase